MFALLAATKWPAQEPLMSVCPNESLNDYLPITLPMTPQDKIHQIIVSPSLYLSAPHPFQPNLTDLVLIGLP